MAGSSRLGALFGIDKEYTKQVSRGRLQQYRHPGLMLACLTITVVLGWILVVVERMI